MAKSNASGASRGAGAGGRAAGRAAAPAAPAPAAPAAAPTRVATPPSSATVLSPRAAQGQVRQAAAAALASIGEAAPPNLRPRIINQYMSMGGGDRAQIRADRSRRGLPNQTYRDMVPNVARDVDLRAAILVVRDGMSVGAARTAIDEGGLQAIY